MYCQNSICIMGCHGNGKISYSPNEFFLEDITHVVVQSEQFGSHEKLCWGLRYAKLVASLLALPVNILPILKWVGQCRVADSRKIKHKYVL